MPRGRRRLPAKNRVGLTPSGEALLKRMSKMMIPKIRVSCVREAVLEFDSANGKTTVADRPERIAEIMRAVTAGEDREILVVFLLNARNQVTSFSVVSIGTLSASLVHPREVFRPAILKAAAGVVVAHNHPSGDTSPSGDDKDSTRRLKSAGELLGIPLVDSLIVAGGGFFSFREGGLI